MLFSRLAAACAIGALAVGFAACSDSGLKDPTPSSGGAAGTGGDGGAGAGDGGGERGPPVRLRVMTWNVKNLFNDVIDSPEVLGDETVVSTADYQAKLDALASVIDKWKPDIASLQEVENKATLDDLAAKLTGYDHTSLLTGNDPRGIDVGFLSKLPIDRAETHEDEFFSPSTDPSETFVFARDCAETHYTVNGRHVALLGVHFKALQDSELKRIAEAEQTKKIAAGIVVDDPSAVVIVLGDFNTEPKTPPLLALEGMGSNALASMTEDLPEAERWTTTYFGKRSLLDDQYGNRNAADFTGARFSELRSNQHGQRRQRSRASDCRLRRALSAKPTFSRRSWNYACLTLQSRVRDAR